MKWIWSLDADASDYEAMSLHLQFYSYSSTSILLWIFERIPHPLLLSIFMLGVTTLFYTILAVGNLVCKITHRMIFRLLCKIVFWNLLKLLFLSLKVLTFQSLSFGRRFKKAFVEALIHASTDEDSESSQNNSSFPSTDDNHRSDEGDLTNQITPLDASVFRPRRRRSRITTSSLRPVDDDRLNSI